VLASVGVAAPPTTLDALAWGGTPSGAELPPAEPLFPRIDKKAYLAELGRGHEKEKKVEEPRVPAPDAAPPAAATPVAATPGVAPSPSAAPPVIDIEQFAAVDLRIATVVAAERVPKSEKLLKLAVDLGTETRTVVAGIGKEYAPEQLVGRQVVVVANLKPAKLMGVASQGMVLAASVDGAPCLLHPASAVPNGTRVK
jgi:methionyl-tRNA synthetase